MVVKNITHKNSIFKPKLYKFFNSNMIFNSNFYRESKSVNFISLACWEVSIIVNDKKYESARSFPVAKN